jgi:CTP:molybdopterin cytidylyltransferase MocA
MAPFAAVVLAAGLSSRIEAFKPLLPVGGMTAADRVIELFRRNNVAVVLVVGHRRQDLLDGISRRDITIAENPDYQEGMFTSVCAGVSRLPEGCRGFFVMPVDIPLVRPATVARLLDEAVRNPGRIIYPTFRGKRGHPTLVTAEMAPEIIAWPGDGGLKTVLNARPGLALEVPVPDGNILLDIDTGADYQKILARSDSYDIPTVDECAAAFEIAGTPEDTRRHGVAVAEVAGIIAGELQRQGHEIDVPLVWAAAVLHDIAKRQPRHDEAGGQALRRMGFDRVGDIVAVHTDLAADAEVSLEARVVYLADKLVSGEKLVSLEERYSIFGRPFPVTPEVEEVIGRRRQRAEAVKRQLEEMLGRPLEDLISG